MLKTVQLINTSAFGNGTVTQVQGNGTVNGITLTGNVTTSGNLTLGGTLSGVTNAQLQNSAITIAGTSVPLGGYISTIPVANVAGAVPNTTYIIAGSGLTGGGALTGNVTLTATNTNSGTVTQVQGNGTVNGITLTGNVTSSGNITLGGTLGSIANSQLSNSSVTIGNTSVSLGNTVISFGNVTLTNATISSLSTAITTTEGGTGLTSYTAGDLPYYSSGSALSKLGIGTSGTVLESNGSAPTWVAQSTLSVGTATNATNTAITDNTSSSATWYPTIVSATTGNLPQTTSSTKLSFVPSTGVLSITGANLSGLTASSAVATDSSKNLVNVTNTGTGNNVLSASPTLTGTANFAGITATGTTKSSVFNTDTGSASVPNATWTTVYTFANIGASQCYLVTVNIGSTGLAGSVGVMGIVTIDNNSSNMLTSFAPSGQIIRMSGLSLQTYQTTGGTQTGYAYTVRIA